MKDSSNEQKPPPLKPQGGQKGSANHFKHGAYSLLAMRVRGDRPDGNTKLGRAFRAREREYLADMGGEENTSISQRQLANDNTWCDFVIATLDFELGNKKRLMKKDKLHPLIELRMRVAAHRRANYQLVGLKRVAKAVDWRSVLRDGTGTEDNGSPEAPMPETQAIPVTGDDGSKDSNE